MRTWPGSDLDEFIHSCNMKSIVIVNLYVAVLWTYVIVIISLVHLIGMVAARFEPRTI